MSGEVLGLVAELASTLDASGLAWCQWKSNIRLPESLCGDTDLDLLIERRSAEPLIARILDLGFRRSTPAGDRRFPGIDDFHGLDFETGRIVHLQLHRQLVLGAPLVKNHLLPVEAGMLQHSQAGDLIRLPPPAAELAVFTLRVVLKARASLLLRPAAVRNLLRSGREELQWLRSRSSDAAASAFLEQHLAAVPPGLMHECIAAITADPSTSTLWSLRRRVARALSSSRRRGRIRTFGAWSWRRTIVLYNTRWKRRTPRKRLDGGGVVIALLGGDGAGKSTAADALTDWLGDDLSVERVHLGKPPMRVSSRLVYALTTRLRRRRQLPPPSEDQTGLGRLGLPLVALERWCLARDRWRAHRQLRRAAADGSIVFCDRYPLARVPDVDGPSIQELGGKDRFVGWLERQEAKLYREIRPPDLAIVLRVTPEIGIERQRGDDPQQVRARCLRMQRLCDDLDEGMAVVDADGDREAVLLQLKRTVWGTI